jgi:hypothetical protein
MSTFDIYGGQEYLAHYTKAATAFAKILRTQTLLMSPYKAMRDPYENRVPTLGATYTGRGNLDNLYLQINRRMAGVRNSYRLLSMTRADDRADDEAGAADALLRAPWARPRMWEQYAENHAGVCLVFHRQELSREIQRIATGDDRLWQGAVEYTPGGFPQSRAAAGIVLNDFAEGDLDALVAAYVESHFQDYFFLKTDDWMSEWEYRFVLEADANRPLAAFIPRAARFGTSLHAVVVGEQFPDWQIPGARELTDALGVPLMRMTWQTGKPWPVPTPRPVR